MQRNGLLAVSVIDCGFGILHLSTSGSLADVALGLNFVLAALLTVLTWQDLRSRGWTWPAPLVGISYLAAPLFGVVLYAMASNRPRRDHVEAVGAAGAPDPASSEMGVKVRPAHSERGWDYVPAAVAAAAGATAIGYARLMRSQGDSPLLWVLAILLSAAVLAGYAASRSAPRRVEAIAASGVVLMSLGFLAMFSIGLPILLAGVVAVAFAAQTSGSRRA